MAATSMLAEKKLINARFSTQEMDLIEDLAEARKYFIVRYFLPIAYCWAQDDQSPFDVALLHLVKIGNTNVRPVITKAGQDSNGNLSYRNDTINTMLNDANMRATIARLSDQPIDQTAVAYSLARAFGADLDQTDNLNITQKALTLVASVERKITRAGTFTLKAHILTKTGKFSRIRLCQAHRRGLSTENILSMKYHRLYNVYTGVWQTMCPPNDTDESAVCVDCQAIRNSPAANNAYDDPELT